MNTCKECKEHFDFPMYEEEVIIQTQPFFGPNAWSTRPTGKTVPICPYCNAPLYDDVEIEKGWIRGPRTIVEGEQWKQISPQSSAPTANLEESK